MSENTQASDPQAEEAAIRVFDDGFATGEAFVEEFGQSRELERMAKYFHRYGTVDVGKFFGNGFPVILWRSSPLSLADFQAADLDDTEFWRGFVAGGLAAIADQDPDGWEDSAGV